MPFGTALNSYVRACMYASSVANLALLRGESW